VTYREQLAQELAAYDIQLTEQQLALLLRHLELVIDKNKVLNLTRIDTPESETPAPATSQPKPPRRSRAAMPSWDEIVFGARTDDDLA
jgi:hypothetical protein